MRCAWLSACSAFLLGAGCASAWEAADDCANGQPCDVTDLVGQADFADLAAPASFLWPDGDVYLIYEHSLWDRFWSAPELAQVRQELADAQRELQEHTAVRLHFIDRARDAPGGFYVRFRGIPEPGGWAGLGAASAGQAEAGPGAVRHELGHIMGLHHAHQRPDRDEYVRIHWENIREQHEWFHVFERDEWSSIGPYDTLSVMHYSSWAFSKDRCVTITLREPGVPISESDCLPPLLSATIPYTLHFSDWNYSVLAALYCESRFCGDTCASAARCDAPNIRRHLDRLHEWEASN
jgi:hypothetical protein